MSGSDWGGLSGFGSSARRDCASSGADVSAERAIEVCSQIINGNFQPAQIARALIVRGDRYEEQYRSGAADADFQRAVEIYDEEIHEAPETPSGYVGRAAALYRLDRFDAALADLDRAVALDSRYAQAYYSRAILRFRMSDYVQAAADYDRAAQLGERMARRGSAHTGSRTGRVNPAINAGRCEARAAAGLELDIAEAACRDAMRGTGSAFAFSRGFLRFRQGDFEQAWRDFAAAAEENEADGTALYGRGVAAIRLGHQAEGEADIARAHELEGEDLEYYANAGLRP